MNYIKIRCTACPSDTIGVYTHRTSVGVEIRVAGYARVVALGRAEVKKLRKQLKAALKEVSQQ